MASTLVDSCWAICGDWNMVELWPELCGDSVGHSALLRGSEARAWNRLVEKWDLVDNFFCAGNKNGPFSPGKLKSWTD